MADARAFVAAFNSPDAPCPVCGVALGSSMMHTATECIAVPRRHLSESDARARVAEGAAEMAIKEAGVARARWDAALRQAKRAKGAHDRWYDTGTSFDEARACIREMECAAVCVLEMETDAPAPVIPVTPALRAAVEAVREADRAHAEAQFTNRGDRRTMRIYAGSDAAAGLEATSRAALASASMAADAARLALADLILSALPPVQP